MNQGTRSRIFSRLMIQPDGCVVWTGAKIDGYGVTSANGRQVRVHRAIYELFAGLISSGLELDHLCRNRACANVDHLEAVTPAENRSRRMRVGRLPGGGGEFQSAKTHCPNGHPYDMREGGRRCRQCRRDQWRGYNARRRQA